MTPVVSIIIKALNEEARIERCLFAALREAALVQGEVVLVDSLSTDRTVELASKYAVHIVQFQRLQDRSCGAAVQLGFQFAQGEFIYVLDADMELQPGFLSRALLVLQADPALAGVGGRLIDARVKTSSDRRRVSKANSQKVDEFVGELGGGGLYRRAAVQQVGYLANRWLAAFEEADLGARLRAAGWRLKRLSDVAVQHEGHDESNWGMLKRLWRTGRAQATGQFLRAAWFRPWWGLALRKQAFLAAPLLVHVLALAVAFGTASGSRLLGFLAVWGFAMLLLIGLKRGLRPAAWTCLFWHYFATGAVVGSCKPLGDPFETILARKIQ